MQKGVREAPPRHLVEPFGQGWPISETVPSVDDALFINHHRKGLAMVMEAAL